MGIWPKHDMYSLLFYYPHGNTGFSVKIQLQIKLLFQATNF